MQPAPSTPGFPERGPTVAPDDRPAVRARRLTKVYAGRTVVESVTFDVERGRVVGLLGRNGAGKTTTLRMLLGLARPDHGRVSVLGQDRIDAVTARQIGVAMDSVGTFPGTRVRQELMLWADALGEPARRVDELIEFVGLAPHRTARCSRLSTGQRQRLRLATALLPSDLQVLVLDEPANGLDPDGIRWMREVIRGVADDGVAVLLSSHLIDEVEKVVDDVVMLDGRILYSGTLSDITQGGLRRLEDCYFDRAGALQ